eukprot:TRINITY_DN7392_c0_g1_i1.p2 TRINITY_DN7392_c0_g1~~TRINITY_DN7392_c0_g1_i1.p2  ORF type:complete len:121 (+),score=13.46 TRINITY_DN7392_c0_g1_i1:269-631(+)
MVFFNLEGDLVDQLPLHDPQQGTYVSALDPKTNTIYYANMYQKDDAFVSSSFSFQYRGPGRNVTFTKICDVNDWVINAAFDQDRRYLYFSAVSRTTLWRYSPVTGKVENATLPVRVYATS